MNFPIQINILNKDGIDHYYFKGPTVADRPAFLNYDVFLSLEIVFSFKSSVEPDKLLHT